jgi:hypothetical protein
MVYAAWVGQGIDWLGGPHNLAINFASLDTTSSSAQWTLMQPIPHAATSSMGPSIATIGGTLYAAWMDAFRGQLRLAWFDNGEWRSQGPIQLPGVNPSSSIGPSLAAIENTLYVAWKGEGNDPNLYYASFARSSNTWSNQLQVQLPDLTNPGSTIGPAVAAIGNKLYAMWVGDTGPDFGTHRLTTLPTRLQSGRTLCAVPAKPGRIRYLRPLGAWWAIQTTFFTATANP